MDGNYYDFGILVEFVGCVGGEWFYVYGVEDVGVMKVGVCVCNGCVF